MKFSCEFCYAKYSIPDERVRGKILKIRCTKCGELITVKGQAVRPAASVVSPPKPETATSPQPSAPPAPSQPTIQKEPGPAPAKASASAAASDFATADGTKGLPSGRRAPAEASSDKSSDKPADKAPEKVPDKVVDKSSDREVVGASGDAVKTATFDAFLAEASAAPAPAVSKPASKAAAILPLRERPKDEGEKVCLR